MFRTKDTMDMQFRATSTPNSRLRSNLVLQTHFTLYHRERKRVTWAYMAYMAYNNETLMSLVPMIWACIHNA